MFSYLFEDSLRVLRHLVETRLVPYGEAYEWRDEEGSVLLADELS